ncbi:MAG: hypothetical protein ACPF96_00070 [Litorivicinaceae bacterium]|jgi:hypothetical protein
MKKLVILLSWFCFSMSASAARDFTRSDTNQEFCKDIVSNLAEVGVRVSHKSMTKCALQVLGGASATFQRSYGSPVNVIVKSNPYRMFVTRGDNEIGTCYVLHPRKTRRKVEDRDC